MPLDPKNPTTEQKSLLGLALEATQRGVSFRNEAERCRMEAENAFADYKRMRDEYKARPQRGRLLPGGVHDKDFSAKGFKEVQDAKGDHGYYSGMATMYATMASMCFTEAQALRNQASL